MHVDYRNPLVWGGGLAAVAAAAFAGFVLMEDRDATLKEDFGIDPEVSCSSLNSQSDYYRLNSAQNILKAANDTASRLGIVGQDIINDVFGPERPICFAAPENLETPIVTGGFTEPYIVVDQTQTSSWLVAQFAEDRINSLSDGYTEDTSKYIAADALFWSRIRYAVPQTYHIYSRYVMAQDEQGNDPFRSALWQEVKATAALSDAAATFEQAILGGATPYAAWQESLKAFMLTPEAINPGDVAFLDWYRYRVGEQETDVLIDVTCDADSSWNDYYISSSLPEGVNRSDVLTRSVQSDIDSECDDIMKEQEREITDYIDQLNDFIDAAEDAIDELEAATPVDDQDARDIDSEISRLESEIRTAESNRDSVEMEDVNIDLTVRVYHDPASSVHSRGFDSRTLVAYVEKVFGKTNVMTREEAQAIASDDNLIQLYSQEASDLYKVVEANVVQYTPDHYNPALGSLGLGLKFEVR